MTDNYKYVYNTETFSLDVLTEAVRSYFNSKTSMKSLFQYAVILHEYETLDKEKGGGKVYKDSRLIIEPKTVLAKSEKDLVFRITREIPEEHAQDPDNVQIIIRPF